MSDQNKIVDIVAQIYESVAYDDVWEEVLANIGETIDAHCGNLTITDRKTNLLSLASSCFTDNTTDQYIETFSASDTRRIASEKAPVGAIKTGDELIDDEAFMDTPVFLDFYRKQDCYHSISSCFYRDSQFVACVDFFRNKTQAPFDNRCKKMLGIFTPHLTRAFNISVQTKLAQLQGQIQNQIKHSTDAALYLVRESEVANPVNERAEELVKSSRIVSLLNDRLALKNKTVNKRFQNLVSQCILTAQGKDVFPGGFIRLDSYEADTQEWHIGVTPYRSAAQHGKLWKAKGALIIIRPVEKDSFQRLNIVLSDFYGLTASETEVLIKVITGLSSSEVAEELNLTKECVRSRLKKIYQKTGVSNQVQLTHNILEGPYKLAKMLG